MPIRCVMPILFQITALISLMRRRLSDALEQNIPRTTQGLFQSSGDLNGRTRRATLDSLKVRPVDVGQFAQPFLCSPDFGANPGHVTSEDFAGRHGTKRAGLNRRRTPHICGFLLARLPLI